ncbi:MAG: hypothetical protein R6W90_13025 [Ignavibacteriaceae bacterium]
MEISLLDKSNYLKGLLIVARKDKQLFESEKLIIKSISERLGFASDFYEETIRGLLSNKYIDEEPIKFSNTEIAKLFVSDGLKLAFSDDHVAGPEITWLKAVALVNDIEAEWVADMLKVYKDSSRANNDKEIALYSII